MQLSAKQMAILSSHRTQAFRKIAEVLGKNHPITKLMGPLAWGRHEFEGGPDDKGLRFEAMKLGYLIGRYDTLNTWARDNDQKGQRVMIDHWPTSWHVKEDA